MYGGASSADASKVCRIFNWIKQENKDLADIMQDVCLEGLVGAREHGPGVTWLMPSAEMIKKLKSAYNSDPESVVKPLTACIMPLYVGSTNMFTAGTKYGSKLNIAYGTPTVSGKTVKFSSFSIELEPSFHAFDSKKDMLAVWRIVDGEPPTTGEPYQTPQFDRKPRATRGGGDIATGRSRGDRDKWFTHLLRAEATASPDQSPVLGTVLTTVKWLQKKKSIEPSNLCMVLDYCPLVTLYLLYQPFATGGQGKQFISDGDFAALSATQTVQLYDNASKEWESMIAECKNYDADAVVGIRRSVLSDASSGLDQIKAAYGQLAGGGFGYNGNLGESFLIWRDQVRFSIHSQLSETRPDCDKASVLEEVYWSLLVSVPGNSYKDEIMLFNRDMCRHRDGILTLKYFVMSTDFLWLPTADKQTVDDGKAVNFDQIFKEKLSSINMIGINGMSARAADIFALLRMNDLSK